MYQDIKYLNNLLSKINVDNKNGIINESVPVAEIANYFKIPIDQSRLGDYQITKFDVNETSIEMLDLKTNTTFIANYSSHSETLGFVAYEENVKFINVIYYNPLYERKSIYYIGEDIPILERLTIYNKEYGLVFKKTMPGVINGTFKQDGIKFLIKYLKKNNNRNYELLSSEYKTNYTYKNINAFERILINDNHLTFDYDRPDYFFYDIEGNIIVGTKLKSKNYIIEGACFEKIDKNSLNEALMNTLESKIKDYSNLDISLIGSAILYAGYSYFEKNCYYHDLEIVKISDRIQIKYSINDRNKFNSNKINCNTNFVISNLSVGNITLSEMDIVIKELQERFIDDEFICFVLNELEKFKNKLQIKNGLEPEVLDPLSPKLLIDKTFDEIYELVSSNKEYYFNLIVKQFDSIVNNVQLGKEQVKLLKSKKSQDSDK